jgi:hypothetical protein
MEEVAIELADQAQLVEVQLLYIYKYIYIYICKYKLQ